MLAVLLVALGPLLALARGGVPPITWTEVCSAQGSRWVAMADGAAAVSTPDADPAAAPGLPGGMTHALQHCPWCALQHQATALPPPDHVLWVEAPFTAAPPPAFLRAPRTLHAWAPAQARAPPAGATRALC